MAISNTKILIKRSSTTSIPSGLQAGELAYSFASNTLFLGNTTGTGVVNIGGYLYTSTIDAATSSNTSNTLVKRGSDGSFAGQLYGTANLAVALANPQNFSISGGDITATAQSFQGNNSVTLNASLNSITGLTGGVYGSASYVPILGIAANGRVMNVTTQQIYTSFNINDGTNSNTLNGGATLFFKPGGGVTTTVSPNTVTFGTDTTVVRSNTTSVGPQTISTDLTVAGNLVVSGTQTYVNTSTVVTNDSLIKLAANNSVGDVVDIGFYGESNTGTSVVYHGLIREGSGGSAAGDFYLFKNLPTDPTGNTVVYASLTQANLHANIIGSTTSVTSANITSATIGTLTLTNALAVTSGGTGTTTSTGTGSVVLNTNPTFAGVVNFAQANVSGLNVTTINVSVVNVTTFTANTISIGQLTYSATGNFVSFGANSNTYQQVVIENSNTGTQASADFVVSTLASTDSTFYGDFGMNGPNFVGTASAFDKANNVYLYSANADLAIGTQSANAIHFITNYSATDAMTISSAGIVSLGTALAYASGGTGSSSYTTGQVLVAGVSGFQSLANVSTTITGALGGNNTITSITTDSYGRLTAYTGTAISGLTVGQGGTGATSFNTNGIVYGGSSLTATASAGTSDQTWTNQILTVTNAGVPVWSTTMDGGTF